MESEDESEGEGSNNEGSSSECREFCNNNEEWGSGSGSNAWESDEETPKAKPNQPPPEASSETNQAPSQAPSIPEVSDKDSEDEQKSNCCDYVCSQDVDFGAWRDCMISEGHEEWSKHDKMICNHIDPNKRVKYPDSLGKPITYMESKGAFKAIKTSEYGLS